MASFGKTSRSRLSTTHPDLVRLFEAVVENYDCSVLEGVRSIDRQRMLFDSGRSKTMNSKHLAVGGKSRAVDVVPYPISWGTTEHANVSKAYANRDVSALKQHMSEYAGVMNRFYHFGGYVRGVAWNLGIELRWGGDWDSDMVFDDQTFIDLPHFELNI